MFTPTNLSIISSFHISFPYAIWVCVSNVWNVLCTQIPFLISNLHLFPRTDSIECIVSQRRSYSPWRYHKKIYVPSLLWATSRPCHTSTQNSKVAPGIDEVTWPQFPLLPTTTRLPIPILPGSHRTHDFLPRTHILPQSTNQLWKGLPIFLHSLISQESSYKTLNLPLSVCQSFLPPLFCLLWGAREGG
jgi:hypothetical protein